MAKRRNFTDHFNAKVALEALRGDKTAQEIAVKHQFHPNQVSTWKAAGHRRNGRCLLRWKANRPTESEIKELHAKIRASRCPPLVQGQWRASLENDFLSERLKG